MGLISRVSSQTYRLEITQTRAPSKFSRPTMEAASLQKVLPKLVLAFSLMLVKDLLINTQTSHSVQAETPKSEPEILQAPPAPHKEASQDTFTDFEDEDDDDEYVAPTQKHSPYAKHVHVKFLICTSWGYKNVFNQYHQLLAQRYGESVQVTLENYPVPKIKSTIATAMSCLKFFLLYLIISGANPLAMMGQPEAPMPEWLAKLQESKVYTCMMIFFVSNAIESTLTSTGAFEIYGNDQLLASKLQTGQVPQPPAIVAQLDELLGKPPGSDNFSSGFQ